MSRVIVYYAHSSQPHPHGVLISLCIVGRTEQENIHHAEGFVQLLEGLRDDRWSADGLRKSAVLHHNTLPAGGAS